MRIPVHNLAGEIIEEIEVQDAVFGVPANMSVIHQALVRQLANARQGNADTKTRGDVIGSTRKLFKQKGTGHARRGSIRAGGKKGSGAVFGPHPRDYRQAMPKKMHRLALTGALSEKVRSGELFVVNELKVESPKTRVVKGILDVLKIASPALVVTGKSEPTMVLSARNIPGIKTLPVSNINVADLLKYRQMVITVEAVRKAESIWGPKEAQPEA
ncbi:MAG: rplD [Dehalococcoidia bacterium]|nr:rplD [Dehalococcoidia bacterium]MBF8303632.1 rplD [Dehalococcoidia bacterium]